MVDKDEAIKYFIAGFIAGEGCFSCTAYSPLFEMTVHKRDIQWLKQIKSILGIGTVKIFPSKLDTARYYVSGYKNCQKYLTPFFDKYLLSSYKSVQYGKWRKKVISKKLHYKNSHKNKKELRKIRELRKKSYSFQEIGDKLHKSRQRIHQLYRYPVFHT